MAWRGVAWGGVAWRVVACVLVCVNAGVNPVCARLCACAPRVRCVSAPPAGAPWVRPMRSRRPQGRVEARFPRFRQPFWSRQKSDHYAVSLCHVLASVRVETPGFAAFSHIVVRRPRQGTQTQSSIFGFTRPPPLGLLALWSLGSAVSMVFAVSVFSVLSAVFRSVLFVREAAL